MLKLNLSKQQLDDLLSILDLYLKTGGLSVLQKTVDLFNALNTAKPDGTNEDKPF